RDRDEREIHRVEHQFDRHEHDQDVAPGQHPSHADREDRGAEREKVGEGGHFQSFSIDVGAEGSGTGARRANATAPITATSNNSEVTSKAIRYSPNSFCERLSMVPYSAGIWAITAPLWVGSIKGISSPTRAAAAIEPKNLSASWPVGPLSSGTLSSQ